MSRYHRCDPRSDYQCGSCAGDQEAWEREAERGVSTREHLERIAARHATCGNCEHGVLCPEVDDAQEALGLVGEVAAELRAIRDRHCLGERDIGGMGESQRIIGCCHACRRAYPCADREAAERGLRKLEGDT